MKHLIAAVRARSASDADRGGGPLEPTRRFEADFPEIAAEIEAAIAQPAEAAAERLFALTRVVLEPGWDEFPSAAADAIARRLGW